MEFWKMNGAGNDFIVVDDRRNAIPENRWPEIVRVLCERHMSIGADGTEQMELVVGEATKMFPAGGILCKRSGFGDYENQYFWQSKVFDGKLFLGTFDTSSLLEPLGQFTNGDLLKMSREEWASQIGYLRVLLKLLLNQDKNGDGTLMAADADPDAAIDAAVDAVSDESPELFTFTDAQHDTMRQELQNGVYNAYYSVSTSSTSSTRCSPS